MFTAYDKLVSNFKALIENGRLSHAYLFFGGDKMFCEEKFGFCHCLANFLENGIFEEPSQLLRETLIISSDEKGTIGIDSIRDLKYFLWQKPVNSTRRIAIIKEAENLTGEAQNAALKIVEEPPESSLIIFISNVEDDLFPALASRLQKIYFPQPTKQKKDINKAGQHKIETKLSLPLEIDVDQFFEDLIDKLKKEPLKNSGQIKKTLSRLVLMKQFNVNKRLQLRALISSLEQY